MSLWLMIGLFLLWQLAVLLGVLRLVRFAGSRRLPRPARVPAEFLTGEWTPGRGAPSPLLGELEL